MKVIQIKIDASEVEHEMQRLRGQPVRSIVALERALEMTFEQTQEDVHVITGSLRGSGKSESDYTRGQWSGTITYGGASAGFLNNPVEYAFYEWRRGDLHDFLRSVPLFRDMFENAITEHFDGGR